MNSRGIIQCILAHDDPPRIGFTFSDYDGQSRLNGVAGIGPQADPKWQRQIRDDGRGGEVWEDEWGCIQRRLKDRTSLGEVVGPAIESWDDLETYQPPTLDDPARYEHGPKVRAENEHKYLLGSLPCCCFARARKLRTLGQYLEDCAAEPEMLRLLNGMVSDLVLRQVDIYADIGCDGVMFCEDWGTQERLLVSPKMWDELFKWTFERLIQRAHSHGMTVWMHSCGYVTDIIGPLVELGMDLFQFDQPDVHGIDTLAEYAHRTTFWCPVDIQKVLPTGDEGLIRAKAREMVEKLGSGGGLIAKDYPDNKSIGVEPLWQHWAYEEFRRCGVFDGDYVHV